MSPERPRWDRRLALAGAAAGVLLLLAAAGVAVAAGPTLQTDLVLVAGAALLVAATVVDPRLVTAIARRRRTPAGSLGALAAAAAVGVLVALDVLAARGPLAADLTRSGQYTLSPQSVAVTARLDSDLAVTGFFRPADQAARRDVQTLLDLYRAQSPRVTVRFVDPDQDAGLASSLGADVPGSLVLQYRTRSPVVLVPGQQSESDVTGAIARLESNRTPVACWAAGDGERDLKDADDVTGYTAAADLLRSSDYRAEQVALGQQAIPAGCDVLVVLQLGRPISDTGIQAIRAYLAGGGRLLLAVDPWLDPAILASADAVLQPYGAAFDGGLVIEPDAAHAATNDSTVPVVYGFGRSPITDDLDGRYAFFPAATPITGTVAAGTSSIDLATTTDRAYAIPLERTDLSRRAGDRPGPFVLMRAIEQARLRGTTRIVLAGTSALAENRTMPPAASSANADLLLASLDWLTQQDALVTIPPKPPVALPLAVSPAGARWTALAALVLPVLLVLAGGLLALARRRSDL